MLEFHKAAQTDNRDDMIALGRELAQQAKKAFRQNPNKMHVIKLDGDPCSGKSLILDAMKAELFGEQDIPLPKERLIAHYRGKIDGNDATVSLVNADNGPVGDALIGIARLTRSRPGFMFIQNQKNMPNVGQYLTDTFMDINVRFPKEERLTFAFKYLGIKAHRPDTPARVVTCRVDNKLG